MRRSAAPRRSPWRLFALVTLPALILCVVILEAGLFRYVVLVDNTPLAAYDRETSLLKYLPGQRGIRYPDRDRRHPVEYTINADGWNSVHERYAVERNTRARIVVIGDSYVEALQVAPREALPARLEAVLGADRVEVYGFGISGAPLSQYLHMARAVATRFHPDVVVVSLVHNDFIESYRPKPGRFATAYMYVTPTAPVAEIPPRPYERSPTAQWLLAHSATARFGWLVWRTVQERSDEATAVAGGAGRYEANVNVAELPTERERIARTADYLFAEFARLRTRQSVTVVFTMDAPREAFYAGRSPESLDVYALNRVAGAAAARAGMPIVDLTAAFAADYAGHRRRFEFPLDNHWNAYAHDLVARAVAERLGTMLALAPH